jgi:Ca2+-binding RTX toxin-like protein
VLLVDFGNDGTVDQQFDRSAFDALDVSLGNGNDHFTATGVTVPGSSTIDGGNGDDTIVGTGSADLVYGGNGKDFVSGGVGHDTAILGTGDDVFRWDPGEGSDDVDGGNGNDVLVFNGAPGNETMSLSAVGTRAVFLRSPGNVVMNLDAVEQLDLHALGGTDSVTVSDVTGTSLRQANIDLSASGSVVGGDGQPDVVTVNGTNGDDHVTVAGHAAQVDVAGLAPGVQIRGSSTADLDRLQFHTLDGNDTVTVDPSALALIGVTTDLGAGQL